MFVLNIKSLFAMFAVHLREMKIQMDEFTANKQLIAIHASDEAIC